MSLRLCNSVRVKRPTHTQGRDGSCNGVAFESSQKCPLAPDRPTGQNGGMDQEREDYGDAGPVLSRRARNRAHAVLAIGALCYPPATFLTLRWGFRWLVQIDLAPLVVSGLVVPVV